MVKTRPIIIGAVSGVIFTLVLIRLSLSFMAAMRIVDVLNMPAAWLFDIWHRAGLPPQSEGSFVGPYVMMFLQWILVGSLLGFLWAMKQRRTPAPLASENKDTSTASPG